MSADDAADPNKAKAVAQQLVSDGVVAVVGHKDSGVSIPASSVYNQAGIVEITPTSSNPMLTAQGFDTVFRVCPIDSTQGPFLAELLIQKLGLKKIAVVYANTAYGMGLRQEFEKRAQELGVTPVSSQQINRGDKDFTSTLQAIQPLSPEAVFYAGSLPEGIIIASQMKELGIKATFVGGDTLFQADFPAKTGSASEGAYITSFFPDVKLDLRNSADRDWVTEYRSSVQAQPWGQLFRRLRRGTALIKALRDAHSTDPAQVKAALKKVDMPSLIGRIAFNSKGDLQDQKAHLYLFQVKNGEFVPVQP